MNDETELAHGDVKLETPSGSMYLYENPQILSKEEHGELGMCNPENPYEFARAVSSIPLVAAEISSAQKFFPVVFSGTEKPVPLAIVGLNNEDNLFIDEHGKWESMCYVPSYLRRHPFALAAGANEKFALVIDRSSTSITDDPEFPFFEGTELSEATQSMVKFCGQYESERKRTDVFMEKLKELDLLALQEVSTKTDDGDKPLANYYGVDVEKFSKLAPEQLAELHTQGYMTFIFAHLFSLENWNRLVERSRTRNQ